MFQTKAVRKIKMQMSGCRNVLRKSCRLCDNVEKYCRPGQATGDNMAHAHCMIDT